VARAGKKGVIIGLSGGIDSSVVAVLSKRALGDAVLGLILPCQSARIDERLAMKLARAFDIWTKKVDLTAPFEQLSASDHEPSQRALANMKSRIRMVMLYYFANTLDYLVAGTGNKSEIMIGYFTKHGDGGCDILPLGSLLKREVRSLARELAIPSEIIARPPTAGLWKGQTDEKEIAMSYEDLDESLAAIEDGRADNVDEEIMRKTRLLMRRSSHKRKKIPVFSKQ